MPPIRPRWNLEWLTGAGLIATSLLCCGCSDATSPDSVRVIDCEVSIRLSDEIPTVATVRFAADVVGTLDAGVEFGRVDGPLVRAPASQDESGAFDALLLGMKPGSTHFVRPWFETTEGTSHCAEEELTTGFVPPDLPEIELTVGQGRSGFFVMSLLSSPSAAVILDGDGDYVWWHRDATEMFPVPRATLSRDRSDVLYLGRVPDPDYVYLNHIFRVALDGTSIETLPVPDVHHDFLELPDGTIAALMHDETVVDGESILGDRLVEFDAEGNYEEIWSIWDAVEYEANTSLEPGTSWSHSNAIEYVEEEDLYYVSSRNIDTIFAFERASGETIHRIGGGYGDYDLVPETGEWFARQHQLTVSGDELLVFSNGLDVQDGSRALGYRLDAAAGTLENTWRYAAEDPLYCYTYGDVNRLPSGNILVTWSTAGQMEEVDLDGEIQWQIKGAFGAGFGYTTFVESLYPVE